MAQQPNGSGPEPNPQSEIAQALKEISRGEQTALQLEKNLDALELRIEQLLKDAEENQRKLKEQKIVVQEQTDAVLAASEQASKERAELFKEHEKQLDKLEKMSMKELAEAAEASKLTPALATNKES